MAERAYSRAQWRCAVNLSALLGWAGWCLVSAAGILIEEPGRLIQYFTLLPWVAGIGLPIAFALCWLIGAPLLWRVMARPVGRGRAALTGGACAATFAAISILLGRLNGLRISRDDSFHSQIGGGDYVRSVDGILTAYGWLVVAQNSAIFIAIGVAVGLTVHALVGQPRGGEGAARG
ncbi:MAG: hypothetical protein AAFM92_08695 [Pseudomonadota bacterium]